MAGSDVSIAFVGSGGAGVLTTGAMLLEAASAAGWYGFLTRSVGAQIRGGEAAAFLRLATHPVECHADRFDLLIGVDWHNAQRFDAEIPLGPDSLVIGDPQGGDRPQGVAVAGARAIDVPFKDMLRSRPDRRPNMIALGIAAKLIGLPEDVLRGLLNRRFGAKGPAAVEANLAAVNAGAAAAEGLDLTRPLEPPARAAAKRWLISGNEAAALGAVRGGSLRRGLSDHAGDRHPRMARVQSCQGRRGDAAGGGRTRLRQYDYRRVVWRHAGADGDLGPGPVADGRGARTRDDGGNSHRRDRCDARRTVDRNPDQGGAERSTLRCTACTAMRRASCLRRSRSATACSPPNGRSI